MWRKLFLLTLISAVAFGQTPEFWTVQSTALTVEQEDVTVGSGTYSAKATFTSTSNQDFDSDAFAVTSEAAFTLTAEVLDNDVAGRVRLNIIWDTNTDYQGYSLDDPAWQTLTYSGTVPTGATSAYVRLRFYDVSTDWDGDATIYLDDVSYEETAGTNLVLNPSFESWVGDPVPTAYTISEIQTPDAGGDSSQYIGELVETSGIVTAVDGSNYWIQDGTGALSGIMVYQSGHTAVVGDDATIVGTVTEYYNLTEITGVSSYVLNSSGNVLPAAVTLTTAACSMEDYEGVLINTSGTCDNPDLGYGEWSIDDGSGPVILDDAIFAASALAGFDYDVTGVLTYSFGAFKILPRDAADVIGPAAATTPTNAEADVISVFSDAFTDLPDTDFNPWWWQSTVVSFVDMAGDNVMAYETFNYQGIQLAGGFDLSLVDYVHFDLLSMNEAAVNVWLISQSTGERSAPLTPPLGAWGGYDISLDVFTDQGLAINDIHQFKFDGGTGGTIYLDNIYFYKAPAAAGTDAALSDLLVNGTSVPGFLPALPIYDVELPYGTLVAPAVTATTMDAGASAVVAPTDTLPGITSVVVTSSDGSATNTYMVKFTVAEAFPLVAAPTPMVNADSVLSIYSDAYTDLAETNFNPNWGQSTQVTVDEVAAESNTLLYTNLNYQGTNLGGADGVDQDFTAYDFLHVDFWTPNASALNFFLISRTTGEQAFSLPITTMEWVSVDIPLTHFTDLGMGLTDIFQFKVDGGDGSTVVYFDNWYFHQAPEVVLPSLVANGDFEAWTENAPDAWTTIEAGITVNPEDNPAFIHGGSWSMRTEITTGDQGITDFRQSLDVVADETYDVSVWVYHADTTSQVRLYVDTYRGYSDNMIVDAWQEMVYTYTAAATGSIEVGLRFYDQAGFATSSIVYIDDYRMTVGVPPVPTAYTIAEIQTPDEGGDASQHNGEFVETSGIVTALGPYYYFIQDGTGDYSGLYVYSNPDTLELGDEVTLIGNISEYNGLTQISDVVTVVNSEGNALPAPLVLTTGAVASELNEGMLVTTVGTCVAVSAAPGTDHWLFQLDDGSGVAYADDGIYTATPTVGTDYIVTGPVTYYYDNFQILPRDAVDIVEPMSALAAALTGAWMLAPQEGAMIVGPNETDVWWQNSAADVLTRACIFDDEYVFNADGSFMNVLGDATWLEAWQGVEEGCGTPIAPHDGMVASTWTVNDTAGTVTVHGVGAYLGIPKPFNGGELANPADAPASITYNVEVAEDGQAMTLTLNYGVGIWTFHMVPVPPAVVGTWIVAPEAGALKVGPTPNDGSWWQNSAADVELRACFFDDEYVFNLDGSFQNILGDATWVETWQGVAADGCAAPVAPHDGSNPAIWEYDANTGTLTLEGVGAYLGIPKAITGGELSNPADAPASIAYGITLSDNDMTMTLVISTGGGFWTFKLIDINSIPEEIPEPLVAAPTPTVSADSVLSIYSDAYANLAETNFNPNWGQSTAVTVDHVVAESNVLFYNSLNYQGTNLGSADGADQDLTDYEYIHIDFWTPNATELNFFLISRTTGEQAFSLPITTEEWVSIDIPLSHFSDLGLGLTDIFQFKVDGGDGSTIVYFDNWYFGGYDPVSVDNMALPDAFAMHQNYPNPFNPTTQLNYDLPSESHTRILIFDVKGREVAELVNRDLQAGRYTALWNGKDTNGVSMPAGIYFARMITSDYAKTVKMLLVK